MRHRRRPLLVITATFAAAALAPWACSFPEILIAGDTEGTGGASSSSSTSTGSTGSTSSSTSSSTSTGSSTGGTGGSGGASTSSTSSASSSSGADGGPCALDVDHDQVLSWKCDPTDATLDCADEDSRARPGAGFQGSKIMGETRGGTLPFDFDCDGAELAETPVRDCPGTALNCPGGEGYKATVACGESAAIGHCVPSGFGCAWTANNPAKNLVQRCK